MSCHHIGTRFTDVEPGVVRCGECQEPVPLAEVLNTLSEVIFGQLAETKEHLSPTRTEDDPPFDRSGR